MRKFDTKVQYLKYKVLREVARQAWNDTLLENVLDIPKMIVPGKVPTMRCCVYKERARQGAHHALLRVQGKGHPGRARKIGHGRRQHRQCHQRDRYCL